MLITEVQDYFSAKNVIPEELTPNNIIFSLPWQYSFAIYLDFSQLRE